MIKNKKNKLRKRDIFNSNRNNNKNSNARISMFYFHIFLAIILTLCLIGVLCGAIIPTIIHS